MPVKNYIGTETFTYQATDTLGQNSKTSTIKINTQYPKRQQNLKQTLNNKYDEILPHNNINNNLNQNELLNRIQELNNNSNLTPDELVHKIQQNTLQQLLKQNQLQQITYSIQKIITQTLNTITQTLINLFQH